MAQSLKYFLLMHGEKTARTVILEGPDDGNGKESLLRVFRTREECIRYRDSDNTKADIIEADLSVLWGYIKSIDQLSYASFKKPLRIEESQFVNGRLKTMRVLRSRFARQN